MLPRMPRTPRTQLKGTSLTGWSFVAVFALLGIVIIGTTLTTRSTITDASITVRHGEAVKIEQSVRADLADNGRPPTQDDLEQLVRDHEADGLRYVAIFERGRFVGSAGTSVGDRTWSRGDRRAITEIG